ncbi:MAG: hypothetical protein ACKOTB_07670, partial [Planctomycetia bacterium]
MPNSSGHTGRRGRASIETLTHQYSSRRRADAAVGRPFALPDPPVRLAGGPIAGEWYSGAAAGQDSRAVGGR